MKLTKGKISKLYSKNKQSLRRKKNGKGKTGRNRTFRKTKGLNLANKSLKSFYNRRGGAEEAEQSSVTPAEPVTSAEEGVKPAVTSTEEGAALAPAAEGPESVESTAIAPAVGGPWPPSWTALVPAARCPWSLYWTAPARGTICPWPPFLTAPAPSAGVQAPDSRTPCGEQDQTKIWDSLLSHFIEIS